MRGAGGYGDVNPIQHAANPCQVSCSQPHPTPNILFAHAHHPCSHSQVFDAVAGENVGGAEGRAAWLRCIGIGGPTSKGPILLLDEELQLQMGGDGQSTVAILPTIRSVHWEASFGKVFLWLASFGCLLL